MYMYVYDFMNWLVILLQNVLAEYYAETAIDLKTKSFREFLKKLL